MTIKTPKEGASVRQECLTPPSPSLALGQKTLVLTMYGRLCQSLHFIEFSPTLGGLGPVTSTVIQIRGQQLRKYSGLLL